MKIEVHVTKRYFFGILGLVLLLAGVLMVYAYGTSTPSVFGHSAGEVEVQINGQTFNLQQAINQGNISVNGASGAGSGVQSQFTRTITFNEPLSNPLIHRSGPTHTLVFPSGVSKARVKVWGAGGAGGSRISENSGGGFGGGGGAYVEGIINVVPGEKYTITVGSGGIARSSQTSSPPSTGGQSSFSSTTTVLLRANGGGAGGSGVGTGGADNGGTGGTGTVDASVTNSLILVGQRGSGNTASPPYLKGGDSGLAGPGGTNNNIGLDRGPGSRGDRDGKFPGGAGSGTIDWWRGLYGANGGGDGADGMAQIDF